MGKLVSKSGRLASCCDFATLEGCYWGPAVVRLLYCW